MLHNSTFTPHMKVLLAVCLRGPVQFFAKAVAADDAIKPFLAIFGKPLKAAKMPQEAVERAKVELLDALSTTKNVSAATTRFPATPATTQ